MSWVCEITGKRVITGNNVSHSHRKTRRRFKPNLHKRRIFDPIAKRFVMMRICKKALKLIDKEGLESVLGKGHAKRKVKEG